MNIPKKILLSDLFRLNVRCDQGIDHGIPNMVWMHPPVHRILGFISKSSFLNLSRNVWRLNQLKAITSEHLYVKGECSISDQGTLDRFPTLINASLLNKNGDKIASIVDLVFELNTGKILYYLVSRSNPKIPGSSRWSLRIDNIKDQQPGMVLSTFNSINELPLIKASVKQEIISKSKGWRTQIQEITNKASTKLEGWLEESPWEEPSRSYLNSNNNYSNQWIDEFDYTNNKESIQDTDNLNYTDNVYQKRHRDNDPWI